MGKWSEYNDSTNDMRKENGIMDVKKKRRRMKKEWRAQEEGRRERNWKECYTRGRPE